MMEWSEGLLWYSRLAKAAANRFYREREWGNSFYAWRIRAYECAIKEGIPNLPDRESLSRRR